MEYDRHPTLNDVHKALSASAHADSGDQLLNQKKRSFRRQYCTSRSTGQSELLRLHSPNAPNDTDRTPGSPPCPAELRYDSMVDKQKGSTAIERWIPHASQLVTQPSDAGRHRPQLLTPEFQGTPLPSPLCRQRIPYP